MRQKQKNIPLKEMDKQIEKVVNIWVAYSIKKKT